MYYTQSTNYCLDHATAQADDKHLWESLRGDAMGALSRLKTMATQEPMPFVALPGREDDLALIEAEAAAIRAEFRHIILVGTGGSGLGAKALAAIAPQDPAMPQLHVVENADPDTLDAVLNAVEPEKTLVLLISKSGNTVEILSHAYILVDFLKQHVGEANLAKHFRVVTQPGASAIRALGESLGAKILEHDPKLGGRFSVMSIVGLLPAAAIGLDVRALRKGALSVMEQMLSAEALEDCYPAMGAALMAYHSRRGRPIHVLMPYFDRLNTLSYWYRQLLSESLGKDGLGITPVTAVGAVDQHSMLQLFLDGPRDKWFTLILRGEREVSMCNHTIPKVDTEGGLTHIMGKTLEDVMRAAEYGTHQTIINRQIPVRVMTIDRIDAATMGALMMHWMLETVLCGDILKVDPYDQPAVEDGKNLARDYLQKAS